MSKLREVIEKVVRAQIFSHQPYVTSEDMEYAVNAFAEAIEREGVFLTNAEALKMVVSSLKPGEAIGGVEEVSYKWNTEEKRFIEQEQQRENKCRELRCNQPAEPDDPCCTEHRLYYEALGDSI